MIPENYRAFSLGSPLAKLFDWNILDKCDNCLSIHNLQHGFKRKVRHAIVLWCFLLLAI